MTRQGRLGFPRVRQLLGMRLEVRVTKSASRACVVAVGFLPIWHLMHEIASGAHEVSW